MNLLSNRTKPFGAETRPATAKTNSITDLVVSDTPVADSQAASSIATAAHYRGETILKPGKTRHISSRLVSLRQPHSIEASRYHRLRHAVESMEKHEGGVVVGITSPQSREGRTLTAINLAGSLAQDPASRVLLIELDLRASVVGVKDYLGIRKTRTTGLMDWLTDPQCSWQESTHFIPEYNLYFMPPGQAAGPPYELLTSPRFELLLDEARRRYDFIIIDVAPVLPHPDSQLISALVDGFMVIVSAGNTSEKMLEDTLNLMAPEKVLGLIFNGCSALNGDTHF